jgi:hypothetical protein
VVGGTGVAARPAPAWPALGVEVPAAVEGGGERLGGQVGGDLGVTAAAPEAGRQRAHVTAVEERESLRLVAGGEQQGLVAGLGHGGVHVRPWPNRPIV